MSASAAFAHVSGTTTRKGALTGLALAPLSTFALLLLEYSRTAGFGLADSALSAIAGMGTVQAGALTQAQLEALGIDPGARAETLQLTQFIEITNALHAQNAV